MPLIAKRALSRYRVELPEHLLALSLEFLECVIAKHTPERPHAGIALGGRDRTCTMPALTRADGSNTQS